MALMALVALVAFVAFVPCKQRLLILVSQEGSGTEESLCGIRHVQYRQYRYFDTSFHLSIFPSSIPSTIPQTPA